MSTEHFYKSGDQYINARMGRAIRAYINRRVTPGKFLRAIICNDFLNVLGYADEDCAANINAYWEYFYFQVPPECFGSPAKMEAWLGADPEQIKAADSVQELAKVDTVYVKLEFEVEVNLPEGAILRNGNLSRESRERAVEVAVAAADGKRYVYIDGKCSPPAEAIADVSKEMSIRGIQIERGAKG